MNITDMKANVFEKLKKLHQTDSDVSELKTVMSKIFMEPRTYSKVLCRKRSMDPEEVSASRNVSTRSVHSLRAAQKRPRNNSLGKASDSHPAMELPPNTSELVCPRKGRIKPTFRNHDSICGFTTTYLHWMLEL